jgi:hypothetical protein
VEWSLDGQWTIEEISIFSNSSHLQWRAGLSDTILKGTIPARFGLIWFSGFRGEDLNVIFYLRNHWANCNQTLVEWSLDGPLPNLCLTSNQDGHQAKNRKKGG